MSAKPIVLPEIQWRWRRVFSFVVVAVSAWLIREVILRLTDAATLRAVALALVTTIWIVALNYLCGATVTDLGRLAVGLINAVRGVQPEKTP